MINSPGQRLEQYTRQHPQEVLLVSCETSGEWDQIAIYKGFSSSLVRATAFDPDVPLLAPDAKIVSIDRLKSPYNPLSPEYIEQGLTWDQMATLLDGLGI